MRSHTSLFAGAAAGVFAVGAVTGWLAPAILRSAHADAVVSAPAAGASTPAAPAAVPLGDGAELSRDRRAKSQRRRRHNHRGRDEGSRSRSAAIRSMTTIRSRSSFA